MESHQAGPDRSLMLENNKRPDGTTHTPVSTPGVAAIKAKQHKLEKYTKLLDIEQHSWCKRSADVSL